MSCQEIRDLFSARADDALSAGERATLDAHLATCGECGREWQRFAATVGLLRAVEPARAPAGLVDRVLAARPRPWYRRLTRELFVPWPVKLPVEAAAVVLVAGLAIMIFQRSPDLQQAARAPEAPVAARAQDATAPAAGPEPAELAQRLRSSAPASPGAPARSRDVTPAHEARLSTAPPSTDAPAFADSRADEAAGAAATRAEPPTTGLVRPGGAREPTRDASGEARAKEELRQGLLRPRERDARAAPGAAAPPASEKTARVEELSSSRLAAAAPADIEARLDAPDRAATERQVRALVARLNGVVMSSGAQSIEIVMPRTAWDELARELARLGPFSVARRPAELPPAVRLTLRLE